MTSAVRPSDEVANLSRTVWASCSALSRRLCGFFYSAGTIFLRHDGRIRYLHALWHAFVIAGSICHYIAVLVYVAGGH